MTEGSARILVVDDEEIKRYTIVRQLHRFGFEVEEACNGQDALRRALTQPDLIILDVKLPDISGLEVCRRIKADPSMAFIPVMHVSATYNRVEDRVEGLDSGADAYLTDVVHPSELLATVRALLRARRAERALREAEDRFGLLVRNVQEYAIFTCDPSGIVTTWNEGVQRILGYGRENFIGQPYARFFASEEEARQMLAEAETHGQAEYDRWHQRLDGSRLFASGSIMAVHNDARQLVGFTMVIRDVTERRRIEEEKAELLVREQQARHEAERANRLKDEFLATLSHELRTPLTSILGWTQLFKMGVLSDQELQEGIETIDRNAKVQAQLIEDLLDVSRVISGKLRLHMQQVEVAAVIKAAISSVTSAAEAKQIQLQRQIDPALGTITADPARLQQVLWNLLTNAIKFSGEGGLVVIQAEQQGDQVEIRVIDNGQGIDPEFLPYVFDRFRQADASISRAFAGLGLGLSIVRHLAELHGGSATAESAGIGHGATFRVRLPIAGVPQQFERTDAATVRPEVLDAGTTNLPDLTGVHILLVEDEADTRQLLHRLLTRCGATIDLAGNSEQAAHAFRQTKPDVLISDIGLPGEDGYALLRRLRTLDSSNNRQVPSLAVTAFAREEDRQKALQAGFQEYLAKPIQAVELASVVAQLAGRASR